MPDTRIDAGESMDKRTVLTGRDCRNAACALECGHGDGEAGPGRFGVARPGIRGVRIEPGSKLVLQLCQLAFQCKVGVEMLWDECCLGWIDRHPSAHQISAGRQGQEVTLDPIRPDDSIGVRCQKYAVVTREFGGVCHGQPARIAGVGGHFGKGMDSDVQRIRNAYRQRLGNRGGAVATVVGQHEDRIGVPGLPSQRAKASRDTISFVPGRDRDNGGAVGLIHR